jgi:hypothetical protein
MTITPKQIVVMFNHIDHEEFVADLPEGRATLIKEELLQCLMIKGESQITLTATDDKLSLHIPNFGRYIISERGNIEFAKTLQIYPYER